MAVDPGSAGGDAVSVRAGAVVVKPTSIFVSKFKTPDSGYEPSFGTGTRMREYGNVESNDLHICLEWPAHLFSS